MTQGIFSVFKLSLKNIIMQNRIRLFIDKLLSLSKKSFYMYDFIYLFFCRFTTAYESDDFPISLKLRQSMFVQGRVDSKDKKLSILLKKCFATPTANENDATKHDIISDG